MRASQYGRFRVRLHKVAWLLPIAMFAGALFIIRTGLLSTAVKYIPGLSPFLGFFSRSLAVLGWMVFTALCSARIATRITKARRITQPVRAGGAILLGILIFYGYALLAQLTFFLFTVFLR